MSAANAKRAPTPPLQSSISSSSLLGGVAATGQIRRPSTATAAATTTGGGGVKAEVTAALSRSSTTMITPAGVRAGLARAPSITSSSTSSNTTSSTIIPYANSMISKQLQQQQQQQQQPKRTLGVRRMPQILQSHQPPPPPPPPPSHSLNSHDAPLPQVGTGGWTVGSTSSSVSVVAIPPTTDAQKQAMADFGDLDSLGDELSNPAGLGSGPQPSQPHVLSHGASMLPAPTASVPSIAVPLPRPHSSGSSSILPSSASTLPSSTSSSSSSNISSGGVVSLASPLDMPPSSQPLSVSLADLTKIKRENAQLKQLLKVNENKLGHAIAEKNNQAAQLAQITVKSQLQLSQTNKHREMDDRKKRDEQEKRLQQMKQTADLDRDNLIEQHQAEMKKLQIQLGILERKEREARDRAASLAVAPPTVSRAHSTSPLSSTQQSTTSVSSPSSATTGVAAAAASAGVASSSSNDINKRRRMEGELPPPTSRMPSTPPTTTTLLPTTSTTNNLSPSAAVASVMHTSPRSSNGASGAPLATTPARPAYTLHGNSAQKRGRDASTTSSSSSHHYQQLASGWVPSSSSSSVMERLLAPCMELASSLASAAQSAASSLSIPPTTISDPIALAMAAASGMPLPQRSVVDPIGQQLELVISEISSGRLPQCALLPVLHQLLNRTPSATNLASTIAAMELLWVLVSTSSDARAAILAPNYAELASSLVSSSATSLQTRPSSSPSLPTSTPTSTPINTRATPTSGSPARRRGGTHTSPGRSGGTGLNGGIQRLTLIAASSVNPPAATNRLSQSIGTSSSAPSSSVTTSSPPGYVVHPSFASNPRGSSNSRPRNWRILTTSAMSTTSSGETKGDAKNSHSNNHNSNGIIAMNTSSDEKRGSKSMTVSSPSSAVEFSCPQMVPCLLNVLQHRYKIEL
jgi:hypothetical protein